MNYKQRAKEALKGNVWLAMGVVLLQGLLIGIAEKLPGFIGFIIAMIATTVLAVGLSNFMLNLVVEGKGQIGDLFYGFKYNLLNNILGPTIVGLLVGVGFILLIVPGVILSYSTAMVNFILADDPSTKAFDAIEKSKAMMKGRKLELFFLDISHIGWILLGLVSFGILMPYVSARMLAARAAFYEDCKNSI
jgi:uncharacterized membrane protein